MRNAGVSGETTSEALSRVDGALAGGGDGFLLMHGTNDVSLVARGELSLETVVANLDQLARRAQARGFATTHATVIPRRESARFDRDNSLTRRLAWEVRKLAVRTRRGLADPFWALDPLVDPDVFDTFYSPDPTDTLGHPNADGYDVIATLFRDVVLGDDSVPPVIAGFSPGFSVLQIRSDTEIRVTLIEPRNASGMLLKETALLINGVEVADPEPRSNRNEVELEHKGADELGCRAAIEVRSSDRADPPNELSRVLAIYDLTDRRLIRGDVDFDCRVDGADLVLFALSFGSRRGDDNYFPRYDIDRNNRIDGKDLAILAENFGKSSL